MNKYLQLTISGLEKVVNGNLVGGNASIKVFRDGAVICREDISGKVSGKFHYLYEILDTGSPLTVTTESDCPLFKAEAGFVNPFREIRT